LNILHRHPITVLVVDDSPLVRGLIREILSSTAEIEVVGEACNGVEAISKVKLLHPDLVTMDIEMPVMGGLEAIERIMKEHPVPILVVTAQTGVRTAFSAVSKGALEVIEKPDISLKKGNELIKKIKILATVDSGALQAARSGKASIGTLHETHSCSECTNRIKIVAIASSTGGPQALYNILSHLPADFSCPIVIAQHIADGFAQGMAGWLGGGTPLTVHIAQNRDQLLPGNVYINPPEFSMRVTPAMQVVLTERSDQARYRPTCDTLLNSVASSFREGSIGVILSGMGDDGAKGIRAIKEAGGHTLAQSASSSVIYGMNRIAVESGQIVRVLSLEEIAAELLDCCCQSKSAAP